jgi:hypothetical protein
MSNYLTKTLAMGLTPEGMSFIDEPKLFINKLKKSVLFEDDMEIKFYQIFLKRLLPKHFGTQSYVPKLITPYCYSPYFKFKFESEKV